MNKFRSECLDNGIELEFVDHSNRYFGDYHRICVEVRLVVPSPDGVVILTRQLERMAVPGAEVSAARCRLVDDFLCHAGKYLARPDTPARLLANARKQELLKRQ